MIALPTVGAAMNPIEATMPMTKATRLREPMTREPMTRVPMTREPMTRVPVFKELHAQQLDNFGSVTMSKDLKLKVANESGC